MRVSRPALGWLLAAALWFLPLNSPHLFGPDEGRYAEIPREMVASGDWVTPRLDGIKYFEKPALQYWATAAAYELFGEHAWTARLWSALCGFLGVLLTGWLGGRVYGPRAGLLAALVQGSSLLYLGLARVTTLDMSLTFTLQLALTAMTLMVHELGAAGRAARGAWRWPVLLGVGVALAVLSKGLVGILIPGAVAVSFMLAYRDPRLLLRAQPWWAVLVLGALAAPWFVLVSVRNPGFAHFFFVYQHFQRYLDRASFDRYQPAWFFVPVLLAGLLPWTSLLPGALATAWRDIRAGARAPALLLLWAGFILGFFSLSQSKLIPYILPLMPALALLIGARVERVAPRRLGRHLLGVAIGGTLLGAAILLALWLPAAARLAAQASARSLGCFAAAFLSLAVCAAVGSGLARGGRAVGAALAAALGSLVFTQAALLGADALPRMRRVIDLTAQLRPWVHADTRFYCVGDYEQPVPFYLRHTCILVGYRGELDYGLTAEPQHGLADLGQLAAAWRAPGSAVAVLRPQDLGRLSALGAPLRVIYTAQSFVVVIKQ